MKITQEEIKQFLEGNDPEKYIVAVEYDYRSNSIYKIKEHPINGKQIHKDKFIPFAWVGDLRPLNFYGNNKIRQKEAISKHGIVIEKLENHDNTRLVEGFNFLIKTTKTYQNLVSFFREGGVNPWAENCRDHITILTPVEQYLVQKEKRLFKGFDDYNQIHRLVFDIETTALRPQDGMMFLLGMLDNRGNSHIFYAHDDESERELIRKFFETLDVIRPTIIGGYNSAFFDWDWIFKRAEILGLNITDIAQTLNPNVNIRRKDSILKLGAEMEDYTSTLMWGYNIIDIAHAVRRTQTINSDIKSWGLKYITKYINANKENRVYVPGDKIAKIYEEAGASAISVLTEQDFFKGEPEYIKDVKSVASLPILRKDFIFEEYQVYESRVIGADAILLITTLLDENKLKALVDLSKRLKMEPLVEVHTREDLDKALKVDAKVIGINNRDLKTFDVDIDTTKQLINEVGLGKIVVSESGIKERADAKKLKSLGVDAILVGETLVKAKSISEKLESLKY